MSEMEILPPLGRPTLFSPELCGKVLAMGIEGKSKAQMAAELGVCRQTLENWAAQHPAFLDALTRARDLAQAWWENQAQANIGNRDFNAALWAKSMAARFPDDYANRVKLDAMATGQPLLAGLSEVEIAEKLRGIFQAAKVRANIGMTQQEK